jgi:hypothetical protein
MNVSRVISRLRIVAVFAATLDTAVKAGYDLAKAKKV